MKTNLEKLPKSDLIWMINRMRQYDMGYAYDRALSDLDCEREKRKLAEADKQVKIKHDALQRYVVLLKPYEGHPIIDIPIEVLQQADAALKTVRAADKRWAALVGLGKTNKSRRDEEDNHGKTDN